LLEGLNETIHGITDKMLKDQLKIQIATIGMHIKFLYNGHEICVSGKNPETLIACANELKDKWLKKLKGQGNMKEVTED
jgi:hypothetical protein